MQSLGQHLARIFVSTLQQDLSEGFEQTTEAYPSTFLGRIVVENTEEALKRARRIKGGLVLWSDGSRLENGGVGAGVAWKPTRSSWKAQEFPLGKGKEVFDAELLRACRALELSKTLDNNSRVTVLLDSQAAITWIQNTEPEPGQALAIWAHEAARWLQERRVRVTIRWVPGHAGVEGNEQADWVAKQAAARPLPPRDPGELSLAHARRGLTETRTEERKRWRDKKLERRSLEAQRLYRASKGFQQDPAVAGAPKRIASCYYQLKTDHIPVGVFLKRIRIQEKESCW